MVFYELKIAISSISNFSGFNIEGEAFYGDEPQCQYCGVKTGSKRWLPPYNIKFDSAKLGDFCSNNSMFIISERFKDSYLASDLRGIEIAAEPVRVNGQAIDYFYANPNVVLTKLDEDKSGVEIEKVIGCERCRVIQRKRVQRLRIDENSWAGEDVFKPSGLFGSVITSQPFVDFVKRKKFTNFHFVHQDNFKEDWSLFL